MTTFPTSSLIAWQRNTFLLLCICGAVGAATLSRTLAPDALMESLQIPLSLVAWVPIATTAFIWFLECEWRSAAVIWLQTYSSIAGVCACVVLGTSALLHFSSVGSETVRVILTVAAIGVLIGSIIAWGFYRRREWARKTGLRLSQFGVLATVIFGFISGIKTSEMWSLLECSVTWYWLTRPEVMALFPRRTAVA